MKRVATIREVQENLEEYIAAAKRGEKRLFGRYGKPEMYLRYLKPKPKNSNNSKPDARQ